MLTESQVQADFLAVIYYSCSKICDTFLKKNSARKCVGKHLKSWPSGWSNYDDYVHFKILHSKPHLAIVYSCTSFSNPFAVETKPRVCYTEPNRVQTTKFSPHFHSFTTICLTQNFINTLKNLENMWMRCCLFTTPPPTRTYNTYFKVLLNTCKNPIYNLNFYSNRIMSTTGLSPMVVITSLIIPLSQFVSNNLEISWMDKYQRD